MPASQTFSGNGDPNGVVDGNPGDLYQDQIGKAWVNTAAPSTWVQLATGSSVFVPGAGAGSAIQNNGSGNASTGVDSTVCGENNQLSGSDSFAEGNGNVETITDTGGLNGATNHLEGVLNTINVATPDDGGFNHVEGFQSALTGTGGADCQSNHVEGSKNTLNALGGPGNGISFNHVEGTNHVLTTTVGTGACSFNHVEGDGIHLTVNPGGDIEFSHFEGVGHVVVSNTWDVDDTHVEGFRNNVTDADTSHIEGDSNTVSTSGGTCNHVEGGSNTLTGAVNHAHIEGTTCHGTASTVHVQGDSASGIRETQFARASGKFTAAGDAQTSVVVMRGSTPGAAPNESVELKFGAGPAGTLTLENGKAYVIRVRAIGYATDTNFMSFENTFAANQEGGVITIKPAPPHAIPQVAGTAGAGTWTLTANTAAAPTRISFTFATGGGTTAAVRIAADIEFIEVARA